MNALETTELFARNYVTSRNNFLKAASWVKATIKSFQHDQFPDLFCDVSILNTQAKQVLVTISGTHGVEGYCGSALQTYLLNQHLFNPLLDWGQIHIHALNPWGMKNLSRFNEKNIDINRNFLNFAENSPINQFYPEIHENLNFDTWEPQKLEAFWRFHQDFIAKHGLRAWNIGFSSGQYSHPDGIMFGGLSPSWSHDILEQIIQLIPTPCEKLITLDLHTGVGDFAQELAFVTAYSHNGDLSKITSGKNFIFPTHNLPINTKDFPGIVLSKFNKITAKQYINIILEYGTYPGKEMMEIILYDRWNRFCAQKLDDTYKNLMLKMYSPNNETWQTQVIAHFSETLLALSQLFV